MSLETSTPNGSPRDGGGRLEIGARIILTLAVTSLLAHEGQKIYRDYEVEKA